MSDDLMSDDLKNIIEAVLLASDSPVSVTRVQGLFEKSVRPEADQVHDAIDKLLNECADRGVELKKIGNGYRYQTREKYAQYLRKLHQAKPPRMSRALLETLAIIAYRQPVTRGDIEEVRGVSVSPEMMQRLIEREWVKQVGVRDVPGRPALFGTTPEFLSYFSLGSLKDLPDLMEERSFGEIAGDMETPLPAEILAAMESSDAEEDAQTELTDLVAESNSVDSEETHQDSGIADRTALDETPSSGVVQPSADESGLDDYMKFEGSLEQDESANEIQETRRVSAVEIDAG
jgi:segregation and condensation protein B